MVLGLRVFFSLLLVPARAAAFQLSQTLTSHMILQRSPRAAVVWGLATPGTLVTTSFLGAAYTSVAGPDQVWRQQLPPQPASPGSGPGVTISFNASTGETAVLEDVLFGDVYLCGGQSNMAYEIGGFVNASTAARYPGIRLTTVGGGRTATAPALDLLAPLSLPWTSAANSSFSFLVSFSAVCFFFGQGIVDGAGGTATAPPIGLISSNVGGTPIADWLEPAALAPCACPTCPNATASYYNSMIAPFATGPMAITGFAWYQGENDVIYSTLPASNTTFTNDHYQCAQAALIGSWRAAFDLTSADFFGVVQLSTFCLKSTDGNLRLARMRQQQIEGISQPGDALVTNADWGWGCDFHPPWKIHPGHRLANASLALVYNQALEWRSPTYRAATPLNASALLVALNNLPTSSSLELWPAAANSQYTTGGANCTGQNAVAQFSCAWAALQFNDPSGTWVNATVSLSGDGRGMVLASQGGVPQGASKVTASAYGWGAIPMLVVYRSDADLPVLPWNVTLE